MGINASENDVIATAGDTEVPRARSVEAIMEYLGRGETLSQSFHLLPVEQGLSQFSASTIEIIRRAADYGTIKVFDMHHVLSRYDERSIRAIMTFYPHIADLSFYDKGAQAVQGLKHLDRFNDVVPVESLTGSELDAARSYIRIALALEANTNQEPLTHGVGKYNTDRFFYISDADLLSFIEENIQHTERIIHAIAERRTFDPEILRQAIDINGQFQSGAL